ncbi:MAG: two-component system NtrC family response regulator [Planctomycetota bacterium]|jgi:two-component system NtrC family response regulator
MNKSKKEQKKLLIVEDDPGLQKQLKWCFSDYKIFVSSDRENAISALQKNKPPVVTLDLGLPPDPTNAQEGLATLEQILSIAPNTKVIVVTGNDEKENALKAIALGAYDFYQKPVEPEILSLIVERAYRLSSLEQENERLAAQQDKPALDGLITASPLVMGLCRTIEKIAPTDVSTLLLGESGTGKELLARAIHNLSKRKNKSFIAINCAAIPETLLESELFGYEKGAFTGAQKRTLGKIEYANEGTLFLDEIGDLSQALQAKLLRFLQERVIERVGGREEIAVDVRIICATHQDLEARMKSMEFREDLFYRISEVSINIPPLRERSGDAVLLVKHFMRMYKKGRGKAYRLSEEAVAAIEQYDWPGNVRELENRVKRATIMAENNCINAEDLELVVAVDDEDTLTLKVAREIAERDAVAKALTRAEGKISRTSELLGVSRPTLYNLLAKYDLEAD